MAVRVAKFREQPWGSELSQRAMPNDEPLKDKNVLAVLEQLTALADTASNYFSASCRRVEENLRQPRQMQAAVNQANLAFANSLACQQLTAHGQQLALLRQQQWEEQQRAWARERAEAVRQASQKPGASKDSPSRLKLKPTPSKDASNMWRKSMTMLSSLTRMGTQQSAAADTAMQPHPDQAAATGLVSQDSSKSVWDQLAHGEGPLTMSIALQHTKSVPLGLEAVQEDEREGQESPLLEGDEEGEGGEQTAAPAAGGLPGGLTKEVLAALEAQDSTASLGAAGGPVKLAPAKVAAVPVPEMRKSMQSFSFSRRVELQGPSPSFNAELRKSFTGRQSLQPVPSSSSPGPQEGRPALRSITGPLARSIAVRRSSIRQRVDEFDEEEGTADPFKAEMEAVFAAEDARRRAQKKEMRASKALAVAGSGASAAALPLTSSLVAVRRPSEAGSLAGSQSVGALGAEGSRASVLAGEASAAGSVAAAAVGGEVTSAPRRVSSLTAASVARRLSEAAAVAPGPPVGPGGEAAARRNSADSAAWGSAAGATPADVATRQASAAVSGAGTRQASAAASAAHSAQVSRQPSVRLSQLSVTGVTMEAGSEQQQQLAASASAAGGDLQFLDLDAINMSAAQQVQGVVQMAEEAGVAVAADEMEGGAMAGAVMPPPRRSISEIEPAEPLDGGLSAAIMPQLSASQLAGARSRPNSRRGSAAGSSIALAVASAAGMVRSSSGQVVSSELPPPAPGGEEPTPGEGGSNRWQQAVQKMDVGRRSTASGSGAGAEGQPGERLRSVVRMSLAEIHASSGVELSPMQAALQAAKRQSSTDASRSGLPPAAPRALAPSSSRAFNRSLSQPVASSAIPGWGASAQEAGGVLEGGLRATAQQWRMRGASTGGALPGPSPRGAQGPSPRSVLAQGRTASWQMLGLPGAQAASGDPYGDAKVSSNKYAEEWGIAAATNYGGGPLSRQNSGQLLPRPVSGAATPLHASPRISYGSRPASRISESGGSGQEYLTSEGVSPAGVTMGDASYPNGRRVALSQPPVFMRSRQGSQVAEAPASYAIQGPFTASPSRRHSVNGVEAAPVATSAAASGARRGLEAMLSQNPVPTMQQAYTAAAIAMNAAGDAPGGIAPASVAVRAQQVMAGAGDGGAGRTRGRWATTPDAGGSPGRPGQQQAMQGTAPMASAGGMSGRGPVVTGVDLAQQQAAMRRQSSTAASRYASASEEFSQGSVGVTPRMEGEGGGSGRAAGSGMEGMTAAEARAMAGGGWGRAGVHNDMVVTAAGVVVEPGLQGEGSRGLAQLPALAGRGQW